MAKYTARDVEMFADRFDLTGDHNQATLNRTTESPDVTSFQQQNRTRLPAGIRDISLQFNGFWNDAASGMGDIINELLAASAWYGLYPISASRGKVGFEQIGIMQEANINGDLPGPLMLSETITGCGGLYYGKSLGYEYVSWSSSGPSASEFTSIDESGSATNLLVTLRAIGFEGDIYGASFQHSTNNAVWVTAVDFGDDLTAVNYFTASPLASASRYRRMRTLVDGDSPSAVMHMFSGSLPAY